MSVVNRLTDVWRTLLRKPPRRESAEADDVSSLRRRLHAMDIELEEAKETLATQRLRLDRFENARSNDAGNSLERMFEDLAAPISQLRMQASLMARGRDISGRSVMALAGRVIETLENHGLEPIGVTGEEIAYDPVTCQPLRTGMTFVPGHPVSIKLIGYRHNGKVLRRALVDSTLEE